MQLLFTFIILVVGVLGRVGPLPERDRHRACGPVRDGGGVEGDHAAETLHPPSVLPLRECWRGCDVSVTDRVACSLARWNKQMCLLSTRPGVLL